MIKSFIQNVEDIHSFHVLIIQSLLQTVKILTENTEKSNTRVIKIQQLHSPKM